MRSDYFDLFRTFFSPSLHPSSNGVLGILHSKWLTSFYRKKQYPDYYVMAFILRGHGWCRSPNDEIALSPGSVIVTKPGNVYERGVPAGDEIEVVSVLFRGEALVSLLRHCLRMTHGVTKPANFRDIRRILNEMIGAAQTNAPYAREICGNYFTTALYLAARGPEMGAAGHSVSETTYETIKAHMDSNFLKLRSASVAADQCHVNYSYVCRLFQRFSKETPQDYLLRLRINHAVQRLHYTDESVKKVALDLGYGDPYVFSKVFKRIVGVSPSHHRYEENFSQRK